MNLTENEILATDTSVLKVIQIGGGGNSGNVVCERVSSTFFGGGGQTIVFIKNPQVGAKYKQESVMVRMGYGMNWETKSTTKI